LDAAHWLAVKMARTFYHLPYVYAQMSVSKQADLIHYASRRLNGSPAELAGSYRPISEPYQAAGGFLEEWLTERYRLYTLNRSGQPCRCDILHKPWPLQRTEAEFSTNTMASAQGIELLRTEPLLHFARSIDVLIWPLLRV
jgi:uncharacterized protein